MRFKRIVFLLTFSASGLAFAHSDLLDPDSGKIPGNAEPLDQSKLPNSAAYLQSGIVTIHTKVTMNDGLAAVRILQAQSAAALRHYRATDLNSIRTPAAAKIVTTKIMTIDFAKSHRDDMFSLINFSKASLAAAYEIALHPDLELRNKATGWLKQLRQMNSNGDKNLRHFPETFTLTMALALKSQDLIAQNKGGEAADLLQIRKELLSEIATSINVHPFLLQ